MKKKNCWEIKQCGREPDGKKSSELGICPAALEQKLNGVHAGRNAGRSCWVVAGTFCDGKPQGLFAKKFASCEQCEVYQQVRKEEFPKFYLIANLLPILRGQKTCQSIPSCGMRSKNGSGSSCSALKTPGCRHCP